MKEKDIRERLVDNEYGLVQLGSEEADQFGDAQKIPDGIGVTPRDHVGCSRAQTYVRPIKHPSEDLNHLRNNRAFYLKSDLLNNNLGKIDERD